MQTRAHIGLTRVQIWRLSILKAIVVTLPFGWVEVIPSQYAALSFLLIYVYLTLATVDLKNSLSRTAMREHGWLLIGMWAIMLFSTLFDGGVTYEGSWSLLRQIIFFVVFFVFAVGDVKRMVERGVGIEKYLLVAMLGMVVAYFGGFVYVQEGSGRVSLEGVNANVVGLYAATGIMIFLDIIFRGKASGFGSRWKLIALPVIALLLFILYKTGSRGGVLILSASALVYFLGWRRLSLRQYILLICGVPVMLSAIYTIVDTGPVAERFETMSEDVRLERLWPAAIDIFLEYPVLGAGFDRTGLQMYERLGRDFAPHNEFLKVATSSGVVGLLLFCSFLLKVLAQTLRHRRESGGAIRLAILVLTVLQLGKGGGALQLPFIWLMFLFLTSPPLNATGSAQFGINLRKVNSLKFRLSESE